MTAVDVRDLPGAQARSFRSVFVPPALASIAAAASVLIVTGRWEPMIWQSFVISLFSSTSISVCSRFLLPPVVTLIVRTTRLPQTVAIAVALLVAAGVGTLSGLGLAVLVGLLPAAIWSWAWYAQLLRISAVLVLVFGFGGLFYQRLTTELRAARAELRERELLHERALKQAAEARLSSLESRVHPHFLFNTLNAVAALIPVDPGRAELVVERLASLLRSSLGRVGQRTIRLDDELSVVRDYLGIEQERLRDRLTWAVDVGASTGMCLVPPFAVQCLVENAVKYGIGAQEQGGRIVVSSIRDADGLRVEVHDTGPGFDLATVAAGHGLDSTVSRLHTTFGSSAGLAVRCEPGRCVVTLHAPALTEEAEPA